MDKKVGVNKTETEQVSIDHFGNIEVDVEIKIGAIKTSIGSLMSVSPGDTLKSEVKIPEEVQLMIDGKTVANGILVEEDGYFCVQVTRVS